MGNGDRSSRRSLGTKHILAPSDTSHGLKDPPKLDALTKRKIQTNPEGCDYTRLFVRPVRGVGTVGGEGGDEAFVEAEEVFDAIAVAGESSKRSLHVSRGSLRSRGCPAH